VDPEDAAPLVTDAAYSTALQVRHTTGVEGHLPAPGATVVRAGRGQPWQVVSVTADTLRLRDLAGDVVEVSRRSVRPDPLDTQIGLLANHWRLTRARVDNQPGSQPLPTLSRKRPYTRQSGGQNAYAAPFDPVDVSGASGWAGCRASCSW